MSPPNGDETGFPTGEEFGFPPEILAQVPIEQVDQGWFDGSYTDFLTPDQESYLQTAVDVGDSMLFGIPGEATRLVAAGFRNECLSVRTPGIPGAEYLAEAADWWGEKAVDYFGAPVEVAGQVNDSINSTIQNALGIPGAPTSPTEDRPHLRSQVGEPNEGYLVQVPNWQDIFQFNNNSVFNERSKQQRAVDFAEQLERSPTPASLNEVAKLLTVLDDIQDEAATLALVLMLAEKLAGRRIPGVGQVAFAADALSIIYGLSNVVTGSGLPGRASKRRAHEKGKQTRNGYRGVLDRFRQTGSLKIGVGDILQGLQATDSMFGVGIQIGGVMGFLQDAFWGGVRGAEFRAAGPIWDPLGFTEAGRSACYRSPSLDQIHPKAYFAMANSALSVWSKASRAMPFIDVLGEHALASTLVGLRLSEQVLGPWLRSGVWVEPLQRAIELTPYVAGGIQELDTYQLRPDQWLKRTVPGTMAAVTKAIGNVADKGRQAFYESLVASTGWGFIADLEPGSKLVEGQLGGPARDAVTLLDVGMIPRFDLGE